MFPALRAGKSTDTPQIRPTFPGRANAVGRVTHLVNLVKSRGGYFDIQGQGDLCRGGLPGQTPPGPEQIFLEPQDFAVGDTQRSGFPGFSRPRYTTFHVPGFSRQT